MTTKEALEQLRYMSVSSVCHLEPSDAKRLHEVMLGLAQEVDALRAVVEPSHIERAIAEVSR